MAGPEGLRPGPWRGLLPGSEVTQTELSTDNAYPADPWVTQAVQKRNSLNRFLNFNAQFIEPVKVTQVVVVVVHVKPIAVVSLVEKQRPRPKVDVTLTKVYGRPTTKVQPKPALNVRFSSQERMKRKYIGKSVKQLDVFGRPTKAVNPTPATVVSQALTRRRPKVRSILLKKPFQAVVVVVVKPQKIKMVSSVNVKRGRPNTKSKLGKPYGRPTAKTKVRAPVVLKFANSQIVLRKRYAPVKAKLGKVPVVGTPPVGSTITFYDGIWVADGLTYHHGLDRPTIILTPAGGGKYTVVKVSGLSDEIASQISKETVLIDGELP